MYVCMYVCMYDCVVGTRFTKCRFRCANPQAHLAVSDIHNVTIGSVAGLTYLDQLQKDASGTARRFRSPVSALVLDGEADSMYVVRRAFFVLFLLIPFTSVSSFCIAVVVQTIDLCETTVICSYDNAFAGRIISVTDRGGKRAFDV
jgi:hypothetical protein